MFITFEGLDGSGKSTQVQLLAAFLRAQGLPVVQTREPGGTEVGDEIREVLHKVRGETMEAEAEMLLYSAARAQLVRQVIRPALAAGQIVIADRYADSTLAYQGYGRRLDLALLRAVTDFATGGLRPDLTLYLAVPFSEGLLRRASGQANGGELNRMDQQARDFYERVAEGYAALMRAEPDRWRRIDGLRSVQEVQAEVRAQVQAALRARSTTRR